MEDNKFDDYVITPLTFTATTITVHDEPDDETRMRLESLGRTMNDKNEQITMMERDIGMLRLQIYAIQDEIHGLNQNDC